MIDMKNFTLKHDIELLELINKADHKLLARYAIEVFNRQRHLLDQKYIEENKIADKAIETLNLWINNDITMWEARKYCWVVLEAARNIEKEDKVACEVLRACSHMLATCHVKTHAEGPCMYLISAIRYAYKHDLNVIKMMEHERVWQINYLKELINNE